jgi:hypothetical protein
MNNGLNVLNSGNTDMNQHFAINYMNEDEIKSVNMNPMLVESVQSLPK